MAQTITEAETIEETEEMEEREYPYIGSCKTCGEDLGTPWSTEDCA
jgi:hypothetical protein